MKVFVSFNQIILIALLLGPASTRCLADINDIDRLIEQGLLEKPEAYFYNHIGRSDPFKPFVSPVANQIAEQDPNEIIESTQALSGMQVFEPGQLTLVGVLLSSDNELAFVEDQARKGYVLKLGTPIGKRGIVTKIELDKVIIEETAKTRSGQEIKNIVHMSLKKDGDK